MSGQGTNASLLALLGDSSPQMKGQLGALELHKSTYELRLYNASKQISSLSSMILVNYSIIEWPSIMSRNP